MAAWENWGWGKFGDSEQFLNTKKLLTVPEFSPRPPLCLRLDPPDITVLSFVDNVEALRLCISEHQKVTLRASDLDCGVVNAHRLGRNFVRADDPRQSFAKRFLYLKNRGCGDDFSGVVVVS